MTFSEQCALSDKLFNAEKSARADKKEFLAKADFYLKQYEVAQEQEALLADARYELWEITPDESKRDWENG